MVLVSGDASAANGAAASRRPESATGAAPLIGRDDALEQLAAAASTTPAVAVITGVAGVGKTRLLHELRRRPEIAGRHFLLGACRPIREPDPLRPIVAAVRQLADGLDGVDLPASTGSLRSLVPELRERLPSAGTPRADRSSEQLRRFRGLIDLLAAPGPTVLAIEDTHWIDEQTRDFLGALLAEPPPNLTVILTSRDASDSGVVDPLAALPKSVEELRLGLPRFDAAQTRELVSGLLEVDEVSSELAVYLCERGDGLPLAIQEQLALLRTRGTLTHGDTSWSRQPLADLKVPSTVRELVLARAHQLTERGRAVAEAAATLRLPATLATLVGACRTSDHEALRGVDEAIGTGLLVEHGDVLALRHPLAAELLHDALPPAQRRDLHDRAATSLEQQWPVPLGQVAHHRREAGDTAAWVAAAERAADRAVTAGDEAEAIRLLDEPLREAELDTAQRIGLALKLGRVAMDAPRPAELIAPLAEALEHAADLPSAVRGKLRFWLGLLMQRTGQDHERQREVFARAVEELDDQPALKASAMVCLALGSQSTVTDHVTWVRRAREVLGYVDDPAYEVFLQSKIGAVMVMAGDPQWRDATDRIAEQTRGQPRQRHEVRAYSTIAECACWAGHHEVAGDWLARAADAEVLRTDDELELRLQTNAMVLDYCRGRWTGLRGRVESSAERLADRPRIRVDLDIVAGRLALAQGDVEAAGRRIDNVLRRIERHEAVDLLPVALEARIRLALAQHDTAAAVAAADQLVSTAQSAGLWLPITRAVPAVVEAMATGDAADRAGTWLTKLGQELRELDAPLAPAALEHAHGLLAAGEGRWDAAVGHFRTAATRYEALGCRYESAQAHEQAAHAQLVAGPPAAEEPLRTAATIFRDLHARADFDRVAGTARLHGISLPSGRSGGRGYGQELSPREREVAELAAAGHTNRVIADKLVVSTSTVKKQLSSAMRKLGVQSRTALSDRFDVT